MEADTRPLGAEELHALERTYPPASVLARNEVPASYGDFRIVQVACKFMYDDGRNDDKGVHCNVAYNQTATVVASHTGCCRSYFCMMQVKDPWGETQLLQNSKTVDDNYCGGQLTWRLIPARQTAKGANTGSRKLALELVAD